MANLARVKIDENKLDYYAQELSAVLKYVEQLNEVDTDNIEPKEHAKDLLSVFRGDLQRPLIEKERAGIVKALMGRLPFMEKNFARVKSVFSKEN